MTFSKESIQQAWQQLSYRNVMAEWSLYALFISGFLLWDVIALPWQGVRLLLIIHVVLSLIIFPLYIFPFWVSHRRLLKKSNKRFLRVTGQCLDLVLLACISSGLYLLIQGNRGDEFGYGVFLVHLISALILLPLIIRHSARWSVLKPIWSLSKSVLKLGQ